MLSLREVALMDISAPRLEIVGGFIERMCAKLCPQVRITKHSTLSPALEEADFVVAQLRVGGQQARLLDEQLGQSNGVIGQETTGVGGMAKALRTIPALLEIAHGMDQLAPQATLINFSNPVSIVTEALIGHSKAQVIGLCNIPISQRMELAAHMGVSPEDVELDSVGLNHLSFIRSVKVGGEERLGALIEDVSSLLRSGHKPANIPDLDFPASLLTALRMIPSDYLRYFFMQQETVKEQQEAPKLRAEEVAEIEAELLSYYQDPSNVERPELLKQRGGAFYSHAALEIITAMALDTPTRMIVDVRNGDTIPELPAQACIEVPCIVDAQGARPLPQRPLEPAIRGLIQHVKAYEEQTIEAAIHQDPRALYLALLSHPLTPSAAMAERLAERLLDRLGW